MISNYLPNSHESPEAAAAATTLRFSATGAGLSAILLLMMSMVSEIVKEVG